MNTSATGGFLQPEPGLARSDIERLIGDVIAGITGLPRDLVRERVAVPQADPETGATWCSFGITKRSESKSQVRHCETEDGQGMSRVLTLETLTVPASFFGPACEDMALKLKAGLHISQNREPLWHANIALVQYEDGEKRYIIAPVGLTAGDKVLSSAAADIKPGNCLPIANIPVGTVIHNIEMHPGKGAQLVRSAGAYAQLMAKEGDNAQIRMPSGEVRIIRTNCKACIGQVGNLEHENIQIGKAGRKRHMGWRPTVRGSVMNPCDHPHGGGEGKSPVGRPGPVTPWGKPALGYKTRKKKNPTDKFIVKRRNVK